MRRSRQRCSDSQCFFSILPLAAALKLPEGDKGQCGTCFGWWGDDAVTSKTGRVPTPWKYLHLHLHLQESLQAGTEKLRLPEVYEQHCHTPKRAETHPAAPNTFASHPLCTSW